MTRRSDNEFWLDRLCSVTGLEDCDFPDGVQVFGRKSDITMQLVPGSATGNMQEDRAAFEAWCLALHVHCGVENIRLSLSPDSPLEGVHPNRFKYRLRVFRELFPDLIEVEPSSAWLLSPLTEGGELKINKSYPRKALPVSDPWQAMQAAKEDTEARLEFGLEVSPGFRKAFGLQTVMRQWPIGVFSGAVKRANELMPSRKSAIDLIAVGDRTHNDSSIATPDPKAPLFLFELKKADNRKAGALGELLFYTAAMRDVLLGNIKYEDERAASNCSLSPADILKARPIESIFITNGRHHPLLEHGAIIASLNQATSKAWTKLPASFREAKITSVPKASGEDFEFSA
jgi:hypothetical protein